jgi:uncharacterized protein (DUF697 family)
MKKLPKAVTRTADDIRRAGPVADLTSDQGKPTARAGTANRSKLGGREYLDATPSSYGAADARDSDRAWRERLAHAIVERHAAYSAIGGMIPVPILNVASITTVIVRMVKSLAGHYNVPFERDRARSIVIGLAMGVFPTGLGTVTSSTLLSLVPGANAIGLVTSSVSAAVCTRSIGLLFVEHFENGSTLADFPLLDRHQALQSRS